MFFTTNSNRHMTSKLHTNNRDSTQAKNEGVFVYVHKTGCSYSKSNTNTIYTCVRARMRFIWKGASGAHVPGHLTVYTGFLIPKRYYFQLKSNEPYSRVVKTKLEIITIFALANFNLGQQWNIEFVDIALKIHWSVGEVSLRWHDFLV